MLTHVDDNGSSQTERVDMSDKPNKPEEGDDDFQIVDPNSIQFAKRGRKAMVDPEIVAKLRNMKAGQTAMFPSMKVDPSAPDFKTAKSRISSRLRGACKTAGIAQFDIRFTVDGVPTLWT